MAELKKEYRTGEDIGKAIIRFFIEEMGNSNEDKYQPAQTTLTLEEIHFLESTIEENGPDREDFTRYYNYFSIIKAQEHWVNYYTQRYYRGFFKILAILQATGSDLENLTLLENALFKDNEEAKKLINNSKEKYNYDLQTIKDLLINNLKVHVLFAFENLYLYYVMLQEIENNWKLGIKDIIPDMKTHEQEFLQLKELAQTLKKNIEHYEDEDNQTLTEEALLALKFFCDITPEQLKPNKEEQELHRQKITELMNFRLDMILSTSFDTNKFSLSL